MDTSVAKLSKLSSGPERSEATVREWLRDHGLLIVNLALFVIFFGGMIFSGIRVYNSERLSTAGRRSRSVTTC